MRFVVIDANVAEDGSQKAVALLDADGLLFLAPDIFLPEVVNALLRQARRSQLAEDALGRALHDLDFSAPELVASARLMDRAVVIAKALGHPIYDCLYLALAERWDTALITADSEFVDRCRSRLTGDPIVSRLRLLHKFEP